MIESDKSEFKRMMNVLMALYYKPELTNDALRAWWHKLEKFDFKTIAKAIDDYSDEHKKAPEPSEIISLCKPKADVYTALKAPNSKDVNKTYASNVVKFVAENTVLKTDCKAWAKRILANPERFPKTSLVAAKEAMGITA